MCQLVYWFPKRNESIEMTRILRMILDQFSARGVSASLCETGSDCSDTDWQSDFVIEVDWSSSLNSHSDWFWQINGAKSSPVVISLQFLWIFMVSHIWRSGIYLCNFIILLPINFQPQETWVRFPHCLSVHDRLWPLSSRSRWIMFSACLMFVSVFQ